MINRFDTGRKYHPTMPQIIEWLVKDGKTYFNDDVRNITGIIDNLCQSDKDVLYCYDCGEYIDISLRDWKGAKPKHHKSATPWRLFNEDT